MFSKKKLQSCITTTTAKNKLVSMRNAVFLSHAWRCLQKSCLQKKKLFHPVSDLSKAKFPQYSQHDILFNGFFIKASMWSWAEFSEPNGHLMFWWAGKASQHYSRSFFWIRTKCSGLLWWDTALVAIISYYQDGKC